MKKRRISRNGVFGKVLVITLLIVLAAVAVICLHQWEKSRDGSEEDYETLSTQKERQIIRYNGQWYGLKENIETVLLIGLDKFDELAEKDEYTYINDRRADFLMLLMIDKQTESVSVIHINRDTMAEIRVLGVAGQVLSTKTAQIALSFSYGDGGALSCRNTMNAVSGYFYDLPIDHYIAVTMDAVGILNDAVGGVTVTVMDDFTDLYPKMRQGEAVKLNSEQALAYVRSRSALEDKTNLHRMERQRQYLTALYSALREKVHSVENFSVETLAKVNKHMISDCSINTLQDVVNYTVDFEMKPIQSIEGENKTGEKFMEFYPDENKFKALVVDTFYEPVDESEVSSPQ